MTVISHQCTDGKIHKILIDYGEDLVPNEDNDELTALWAKADEEPIDAVFFTHYHGDHTGKITEIPDQNYPVAIYMSEVSKIELTNINKRLVYSTDSTVKEKAKKLLSILTGKVSHRPIAIINNGQTVEVANTEFKVTAYRVDHSAYYSYMYLIETPDKRILHTGDYRNHGYMGELMNSAIDTIKSEKGEVDILITEGTMMSRMTEDIMKEEEMQAKAREIMHKHKYVFLICSSANLDSIASFYNAADGKKYLYTYNSYSCEQIRSLAKYAKKSSQKESEIYDIDKIFELNNDDTVLTSKFNRQYTQKELMKNFGFIALIKPEDFCEKYIDEFLELDEKPAIIYSMWNGFLRKNNIDSYNETWDKFLKKYEQKGVTVYKIHTSGHASTQFITEVINKISPREAIYPIHTENYSGFYNLEIGDNREKIVDIMNFLNEEETEELKKMGDNRGLYWELPLFKAYYETDGAFNEFCKLVEARADLVVCFRGNSSPKSIIIYHNNHKMWMLSTARTKGGYNYHVSISSKHARYVKNYDALKAKLSKLGFDDYKGKNFEDLDTLVCSKQHFTKEFVDESFEILQDMFKTYFDVAYQYDNFKKATVDKRELLEKTWQQALFTRLQSFDGNNGLFAYDLEFSQKFPNKKIKKKLKGIINEPDIMAAEFTDGKISKLISIEVKSTATACEGNSGIGVHMPKMYAYSKIKLFEKNRKEEAISMIGDYQKLGVFPYEKVEFAENFITERWLLLTGEAIQFYEDNAETIKKWSKNLDFKIVLVRGTPDNMGELEFVGGKK